MPYSASNVPDYVPKAKAKQWADIWNSAFKKAKDSGKSEKDAESSAFAQANGVINKEESKSFDCRAEIAVRAQAARCECGGEIVRTETYARCARCGRFRK